MTTLGCATVASVGPAPAPDALAALSAPEDSGQWLFRAELSGEEGSGSLKLLLRRYDGGRFMLQASDALGQARWEIRRDRDAGVWLDPQGRRFCRLDARLPLRATQWVSKIRLADFPGLLTGEWPSEAEVIALAAPAAPAEATAAAGPSALADRRITGERGESGWASWTLWEEGLPAVWFKRLGAESLLSVRRPSVQFRWRVTAQSALPLTPGQAGAAFILLPGELLESSREIACPGNAIP